VGRFDGWLNNFLEECAREVGVDVTTYVARAVAAQMVADQRRADSPLVEELIARLAESRVFADAAMPSTSAVLTDPDRVRALNATLLLDSPPEEIYDRVTRAAAEALGAPSSSLTLVDVDRQFFKSTAGANISSEEERQTPLDRSLSQYTVANGSPLILEDARLDPVFRNHSAVRDGTVVAYLGIPLIDRDGNAVGTLCVFDDKPRSWASGHVQILSSLALLAAERMFNSVPNGGH
jgi:GAF domain